MRVACALLAPSGVNESRQVSQDPSTYRSYTWYNRTLSALWLRPPPAWYIRCIPLRPRRPWDKFFSANPKFFSTPSARHPRPSRTRQSPSHATYQRGYQTTTAPPYPSTPRPNPVRCHLQAPNHSRPRAPPASGSETRARFGPTSTLHGGPSSSTAPGGRPSTEDTSEDESSIGSARCARRAMRRRRCASLEATTSCTRASEIPGPPQDLTLAMNSARFFSRNSSSLRALRCCRLVLSGAGLHSACEEEKSPLRH
jgi:hypothetical protein